MIHPKHQDDLLASLASLLGAAHAERAAIEASGFEADPRCAEVEGLATVAARAGRWGDALFGLLCCATWEPDVYLGAWSAFGLTLVELAGDSEAAGVPLPATVVGRRWASEHGNATQLHDGRLRIQVANGKRTDVVTLPLKTGGRRG